MKPLYIFDLDGTLADIKHRRHHVECERDKQDWKTFYAACTDDRPVRAVINMLDALWLNDADIWIWSGRSDEVRTQTCEWLSKYVGCDDYHLMMREAGDSTADDVLKKSWYDNMLDVDQKRLIAVFDDRDRMVKMWRGLGVPCFQVAEGNF